MTTFLLFSVDLESGKGGRAGTSLVVQQLGLRASTAGGAGSIPGPGAEIPQGTRPHNKGGRATFPTISRQPPPKLPASPPRAKNEKEAGISSMSLITVRGEGGRGLCLCRGQASVEPRGPQRGLWFLLWQPRQRNEGHLCSCAGGEAAAGLASSVCDGIPTLPPVFKEQLMRAPHPARGSPGRGGPSGRPLHRRVGALPPAHGGPCGASSWERPDTESGAPAAATVDFPPLPSLNTSLCGAYDVSVPLVGSRK